MNCFCGTVVNTDNVHSNTNDHCCHCNCICCLAHTAVVIDINAYMLEKHCTLCAQKCTICKKLCCTVKGSDCELVSFGGILRLYRKNLVCIRCRKGKTPQPRPSYIRSFPG